MKLFAVRFSALTPSKVIEAPSATCDHRIAFAIRGEPTLNVNEAREFAKSNQIDPIMRDIEAVDRVIAYWLRQYKHIIAA